MAPSARTDVAAEAVAAEALAFLAADRARIERFLGLTGVDPARIREVAGERPFLAAVLEYMVADEPLLLAFAEESGRPIREVTAAQARLSGPVWERDSA
jgi:hypothetical protein